MALLPTLDTYLSLVTSLYRGKPNFIGLCSALAQPLVDQQALLAAIRTGFDLDTAVGVQLDQVGIWIGRSRYLETPLEEVYFSYEIEGVGWEEGSWQGPYDPDTYMVALPDESYRTLLKAKVAANAWDGTIPGAYEVWETLFAAAGSYVAIRDNQDMSMLVILAGARPDAVIRALLMGGYIPLKPEGVRIESYAMPPDGGAVFAWNRETNVLDGWGEGSWPEFVTP